MSQTYLMAWGWEAHRVWAIVVTLAKKTKTNAYPANPAGPRKHRYSFYGLK